MLEFSQAWLVQAVFLCLGAVDELGQSGDLAGGGVLVNHAFLCCDINNRLGRIQNVSHVFGFGLFGSAYGFDGVFHTGFNGHVTDALLLALDRSFLC